MIERMKALINKYTIFILRRSGKRVSFGLWPSEANLEDADDVEGNEIGRTTCSAAASAATSSCVASTAAGVFAAAAAPAWSRRGSVDDRFRVGSTGSTGSAKRRKIRVQERLRQREDAAAAASAAAAAAGQVADGNTGAVVGGASQSFTLVSIGDVSTTCLIL